MDGEISENVIPGTRNFRREKRDILPTARVLSHGSGLREMKGVAQYVDIVHWYKSLACWRHTLAKYPLSIGIDLKSISYIGADLLRRQVLFSTRQSPAPLKYCPLN